MSKFYPSKEDIDSPRLRAEGNLSYLEFLALVKHLWEESHPDIPLCPTQGPQYATYPAIIYGLEMRKTHPDEPKTRYRQDIDPETGEHYLVYGQRFQNIVSFTVITETDPYLCEAIIEEFEDFMMEMIPVLKRLGLSEIIYSRRMPDQEDNRTQKDICKRTVTYFVTIEKLKQVSVGSMQEIVSKYRTRLEGAMLTFVDQATPSS